MWLRNRNDLTNSFVENPDYLKSHENEFDEHDYQVNLRDWTIPFGRKFRAIRVWLTLKWFGRSGLEASSRQHLELALLFRSKVEKSELFELIYPTIWGLVCFRLKDKSDDDHDKLARMLKKEHGLVMTTSIWHGKLYLRATFNQLTSSGANVEKVFTIIENCAKKL